MSDKVGVTLMSPEGDLWIGLISPEKILAVLFFWWVARLVLNTAVDRFGSVRRFRVVAGRWPRRADPEWAHYRLFGFLPDEFDDDARVEQ